MSNLGYVGSDSTVYQVTSSTVTGSWPSAGTASEANVTLVMPTLAEADIKYTSILLSGGFWAEAANGGVGNGTPIPVQVCENYPSSGVWSIDAILFADAAAQRFGTPPGDSWILHGYANFLVQPVYPAV